MSDLVAYRLEDAVATITMDDGKVNVMSTAMLRALDAAVDRAQGDKEGIRAPTLRPTPSSSGRACPGGS